MKDLQIEHVVANILSRSGSDVKVELEDYFPGDRFAGGKYSFGTHTITLYIEEIKAQCLQIFSSLEFFDDYLAVVFAHEIGHAEDSQLAFLIDKMDACEPPARMGIALEIEMNAWEYAKKLISLNLHPFMETIIQQSLQPYYETLEVTA